MIFGFTVYIGASYALMEAGAAAVGIEGGAKGMTIYEFASGVDSRVYVYSVLGTGLFHDALVFLESINSPSAKRYKPRGKDKVKKLN